MGVRLPQTREVSVSDPASQVVSIVAGGATAAPGAFAAPLLDAEDLRFANPSHLMVAQTFLTMITAEEVRQAVQRAASLSDLKVLLLADEFFARVTDPARRAEMSALLRSPRASLDECVALLVRSLSEPVYCADVLAGRVSRGQPLHSVRSAADTLSISPVRVFQAVADGKVDAVVCLTDAGLSQLRDDVRQRGRAQW